MNTEADTVADDGHCSLREAITSANLDTASGASAGECAAGSGADTVLLDAGLYVLTKPGNIENNNVTGDLDLGSDISIHGAGSDLTTIYAAQVDRVIDIPAPHVVSIDAVTLAGGRAADGLSGVAGQPGTIGGGGGGIRNTGGTLSLANVVVRDNTAGNGGNGGAGQTAGGPGGAGGGISSTGPLTLTNTLVADNFAGSGGTGGSVTTGQGPHGVGMGNGGAAATAQGGLGGPGGAGGGMSSSGSLTITASTVRDNIAGDGGTGGDGHAGDGGSPGGNGGEGHGGDGGKGGSGGGVAASGATDVQSSTVDGNRSGRGGFGGTGDGGDGDAEPGHGGDGQGGKGGGGGVGGGLMGDAPAVVNTTFDRNVAGTGGTGGLSFGGNGGASFSSGVNGARGGNVVFGFGGDGGAGGGVWASGTSNVTHATITANRAGGAGPGTSGFAGTGGAGGGGGAVQGAPGSNSSGKSGSPGLGGGAFNPVPPGHELTLTNTIFAANVPATCGATVTDGGHNVSFPFGCPGSVADPRLGALASYGGPVETRAPVAGSPAIDAVPASGAGCPATDARGVSRPQGSACDAGAYEVAPPGAATGAATAITTTSATVSGSVTPNGRATRYHFEYGTSTGYGSRAPDADAGAGIPAVAVFSDLSGLAPSTTYHYRLVATNGDGRAVGADQSFTTAAPDTGPGPDLTAPVITAASLTPTRFALNSKGPAETAVAARAKKGTTFKYSVSELARVVFTIQRAAAGRKVGKKCRKPTRSNRRKPKCTRYSPAGRFAQLAAAGANAKQFSGKIGLKKLTPGSYRATLVATDAAGNHSLPKRLRFRVVLR